MEVFERLIELGSKKQTPLQEGRMQQATTQGSEGQQHRIKHAGNFVYSLFVGSVFFFLYLYPNALKWCIPGTYSQSLAELWEGSRPQWVQATQIFIHCHSVHDYPALPPEAAYKWPLKRGGQGVGRAEWPDCWLRHFLTALSRSLSRPFIWAVDERKRAKAGGTRGERDFTLAKIKVERVGKSSFLLLWENVTLTIKVLVCFIFNTPKQIHPESKFSPAFTATKKMCCSQKSKVQVQRGEFQFPF